ncbi:MAG: isoprenyl transferase [Trueperaceae bacterium]|nr:isoprenyl transferase [Trueperaceae bacterium]MCC6309465.1 isoprenyl transferase [Trueperaceae bacterium]
MPAKPVANGALRAFGIVSAASKPLYWLYERRLTRAVKAAGHLPRHIGIIMDGNRRFAKAAGLDVKAGHDYGATKAREVLDWCLELGIPHVTLWGFSTENRSRSAEEVGHLHRLFAEQAKSLLNDERLHANRVKVRIIGDIADFPAEAKAALAAMEDATRDYDGMHLNVALGYGGREEIVDAVKRLAEERAAEGATLSELAAGLSAEQITRHLYTAGLPDPDFVIRTSGEVRLSGFLLWQTAYSEFYFCDANWPEFRKVDFLRAVRSFQARERRFGK